MLYLLEIRKLHEDIGDFNGSPSSLIECFHIRTEFSEVYHLLTDLERKELSKCDVKLIQNATTVLNYLQPVSHEFHNQKRPVEEWWWHLDKVVSGEVIVKMEISSQGSVLQEK